MTDLKFELQKIEEKLDSLNKEHYNNNSSSLNEMLKVVRNKIKQL